MFMYRFQMGITKRQSAKVSQTVELVPSIYWGNYRFDSSLFMQSLDHQTYAYSEVILLIK